MAEINMNSAVYSNNSSQKVAVVGSGISGLSAAWLLGQKHRVTLFEKNAKLGGHTNTLSVEVDGKKQAVDTGFIVFNRPNYPHLSAMFEHLQVATQNTEMSFSASINGGELEYSGNNLNTLFAQRRNLLSVAHWGMIRQILRFNKQAKADLANDDLLNVSLSLTLGDYLQTHGFSERMRDFYLLPMAAAIWSCPVSTMLQFPVRSFLNFFENHGLLNIEDRPQWETVIGGSNRYIQAILDEKQFDVRLDSAVQQVEKTDIGLLLRLQDGHEEYFDHIIFASHADQTYCMLQPELQFEFEPLRAFQYQENIAYLHSDTDLMPRRKLAWASWNYLRNTSHPENRVAVTYWMNLLQNIETETPLLVTLNPIDLPKAESVFERIVYEHPVFDRNAMQAQHRLVDLQGKHNLWFCGAYTGYGFHEDGLRSAVNLARMWNIDLPWEKVVEAEEEKHHAQ